MNLKKKVKFCSLYCQHLSIAMYMHWVNEIYTPVLNTHARWALVDKSKGGNRQEYREGGRRCHPAHQQVWCSRTYRLFPSHYTTSNYSDKIENGRKEKSQKPLFHNPIELVFFVLVLPTPNTTTTATTQSPPLPYFSPPCYFLCYIA